MGDRASCAITIGGHLPLANLDELCQHVEDYNLCEDWGGEAIDPAAFAKGVPLEMYVEEINGGAVSDLESFCLSHKLHFRRISGGCQGAFCPEIVVSYGTGVEYAFDADDDGKIVLSAETIQKAVSLSDLQHRTLFATRPIPPLIIDADPLERAANGDYGFVLATCNDGEGLSFWNSQNGFGPLFAATVFTEDEAGSFDTPIANARPEWLALPTPVQVPRP